MNLKQNRTAAVKIAEPLNPLKTRILLPLMKTRRTILTSALLLGIHCAVQVNTARAADFVDFTWPTNGQQLVTFTGLAGTAQAATGTIQQVVFSIYDQTIGQWWGADEPDGPDRVFQSGDIFTSMTPALARRIGSPKTEEGHNSFVGLMSRRDKSAEFRISGICGALVSLVILLILCLATVSA